MTFRNPTRGRAIPSSSSATTTITSTEASNSSFQPTVHVPISGSLHLRASAEQDLTEQNRQPDSRHVQWAEDVVNNEGMGKKSSKVCCIYHKPRVVGESSSEEDSSSSSDSDSDGDGGPSGNDDGAARPSGHESYNSRNFRHNGPCDHNDVGAGNSAKTQGNANGKRRSPNAYEKMPRNTTSAS